MSDFVPPRMEHAVIDEETQMMQYLADIAMEDLLLLGGKRRERPDGLIARYKRHVLSLDDGNSAGSGYPDELAVNPYEVPVDFEG